MVKKITKIENTKKGKTEKIKNTDLPLKQKNLKTVASKKGSNIKKVGIFKRIAQFCRELKSELKKVVWPTKKNIFTATLVVVVFIIIMALFVMFADYIFHGLLNMVLKTL